MIVQPANPPLMAAVDSSVEITPRPENSSSAETTPQSPTAARARSSVAQIVLMIGAAIGFLYFARAAALPVVLACVAGMALKPLVRGLGRCGLPRPVSAAILVSVLMAGLAVGFVELGRPAVAWVNETPEHLQQLRERAQGLFRPAARITQAAVAVTALGSSPESEQRKAPLVEIKDNRMPGAVVNWTGSFLAGVIETFALLYLLLASGDLFLQKLVRVLPTLRDKKRAVEITHEVQANISTYLFTVSMVNLGLGMAVAGGLYLAGVPNAAMWGMLAALVNYIPYFGPVAGIILLGIVGLLSFDTPWKGLFPPAWYLVLHVLETNLITPVLLGRRFTLNPVVIFISLIFWTWLWGVLGALLSVPLLVTMKAICDRVPSLSPASEFLSS